MLVLSAWAACLPPTEDAFSFYSAARWLLYFCSGSLAWTLIAGLIVRRQYGDNSFSRRVAPTIFHRPRRLVRLIIVLTVAVILQNSPLLLRFSFYIAKPALDRYAHRIDATPFADKIPPTAHIGIYYFVNCDRCPHGIALRVFGGGGFFYRTDPGVCLRHQIERPIAGNWSEMSY